MLLSHAQKVPIYRKDQVVATLLQGSTAAPLPCVNNILASLYQPCYEAVVKLEQGCRMVGTKL